MKRPKFSQEQIAYGLRAVRAAGRKVTMLTAAEPGAAAMCKDLQPGANHGPPYCDSCQSRTATMR